MQNNNVSVTTARAVRESFVRRFFSGSGPGAPPASCDGDFHQAGLCLWQNDPCLGPIGPFTVAQVRIRIHIWLDFALPHN